MVLIIYLTFIFLSGMITIIHSEYQHDIYPNHSHSLKLILEHMELFDPNMVDKRSTSKPIRSKHAFRSWDDVINSIEKNGNHKFCSLVRDNWACAGPEYEKVLSETKVFSFDLM